MPNNIVSWQEFSQEFRKTYTDILQEEHIGQCFSGETPSTIIRCDIVRRGSDVVMRFYRMDETNTVRADIFQVKYHKDDIPHFIEIFEDAEKAISRHEKSLEP